MRLHRSCTWLAALPLALALHAQANPVFSTGGVVGTVGGQNISSSFTVSNSFTLGSDAHITDFSFGLWLTPSSTFTSLTWSIGTSFFGASVASGTATSFTSSQLSGNVGYNNAYRVYDIGVDIPDLDLAAGTYYLTLDAVSAPDGGAYWDIATSGASPLARQRSGVNELGDTPRNTFTLNGTEQSVPEPGSLALLGAAMLAALGASRRRAC